MHFLMAKHCRPSASVSPPDLVVYMAQPSSQVTTTRQSLSTGNRIQSPSPNKTQNKGVIGPDDLALIPFRVIHPLTPWAQLSLTLLPLLVRHPASRAYQVPRYFQTVPYQCLIEPAWRERQASIPAQLQARLVSHHMNIIDLYSS